MLNREVEKKIRDHDAQLEQRVKKGEVTKADLKVVSDSDLLDLNNFNEATRKVLQGLSAGQVNAVLGNKNVKLENLSISVRNTVNLFDKNSSENLLNQSIRANDGTTYSSTDWIVSHYIEVEGGKNYTRRTSAHMAWYDSNKNYISGVLSSENLLTITAPPTAKYMRTALLTSDLQIYMVVEGNSYPSSYIEYKLLLDGEYIKPSTVVKKALDYTDYLGKTMNFVPSRNLFNKNSSDNQLNFAVNSASGATYSANGFYASHYMIVNENTTYIRKSSRHMAWYDSNKNYISGVSQNDNLLMITSPVGAKYAKVTIEAKDLADYMFVEGNLYPSSYIEYGNNLYLDGARLAKVGVDIPVSKWLGKKWISYGDSITDSNGWQPNVSSLLGLNHTKRGIGGTTATENGSIAWIDTNGNYLARPDKGDTKPEGSIEIKSSGCNSERINAMIPVDTELLTIMFGTNDKEQNKPLGSIPTASVNIDETTFIGALCSIIEKVQTKIPTCRIILMSPVPRSTGNFESANTLGLKTRDYAKAVQQVAELYSIPFIDLNTRVGWNNINGTTYITDGIHPNANGYKRVSEIVIGELKRLEPTS